jgi:outer membrane PBP1 activator LpoA protein
MLREVEGKANGAEQVGLRLRRAELALAAGDGQRARTILQAMAPSVPALSPHRQAWAVLSARAAIAAGDPKAAQQLLAGEKPAANDPSLRTALLEASLAAGDWNAVAELFRPEVPADPARAGARHDDPALQDAVLGLAAALSNAGRTEEAAALGETWGPVMDKTQEGLVFRALTRPTPLPIDELRGMAEQVARHYGS